MSTFVCRSFAEGYRKKLCLIKDKQEVQTHLLLMQLILDHTSWSLAYIVNTMPHKLKINCALPEIILIYLMNRSCFFLSIKHAKHYIYTTIIYSQFHIGRGNIILSGFYYSHALLQGHRVLHMHHTEGLFFFFILVCSSSIKSYANLSNIFSIWYLNKTVNHDKNSRTF